MRLRVTTGGVAAMLQEGHKLIWLVPCTAMLCAVSAFGADPSVDRMGELSKQIEALSQKLEQCGSNQDCLLKVAEEMMALEQEYGKLAQSTQKVPGGQPISQIPSCATFFRPGWSCLPIKISVSRKIEERGYDSYCDPPGIIPCNRKEYVSRERFFRYTAEGEGILVYTKNYAEFEIWTHGAVPGAHLAQYQGLVRTCDRTEGGGFDFPTRIYPTGGVTVKESFGFSVKYPAEAGTPTNCWYSGVMVATADSDYPGEKDMGFNPKNVDLRFIMTPEIVKSAVSSGQFTKNFHWRVVDTDGKSYEDNLLDVRMEFGKPPPEEPGALAVSPGDGFSSSRTDPKKSFEPLSKTYTISNKGKQSINYSVSKKATWLKLDNTGGSLAPGGSATVAASVDVPVASKLTEDTHKDTITFTNTTNGKGNTTRPADLTIGEEQKWQVFLTGYEIDEMNPYWKITTKVRGAIRFDYKLRGEFTIAKKKGKWTYKSGTITIADVGLSNLYEPLSVWMVKPLKCLNCFYVTNLKGGALSGYVDGNIVKLHWGNAWPKVLVEAKITVPCKPMPKCAEWGNRLFVSTEFFDRVNNVPLPLKHEGVVKPPKPVVSPQGSRWINYTYTLRRLK